MPSVHGYSSNASFDKNIENREELMLDDADQRSIYNTIIDLEENILYLLQKMKNSNRFEVKKLTSLHLEYAHMKYSGLFKKEAGFQLIALTTSIVGFFGSVAGIVTNPDIGKKVTGITDSLSKGGEFGTQAITKFSIDSHKKELDYAITFLQQQLQEQNKQDQQISETDRTIRETLNHSLRNLSELVKKINNS